MDAPPGQSRRWSRSRQSWTWPAGVEEACALVLSDGAAAGHLVAAVASDDDDGGTNPLENPTLRPPPAMIDVHLSDSGPRPGSRMAAGAQRAARALARRGFCVCRGGLDADFVAEARREASTIFANGAMRPGVFTTAGETHGARDDHTRGLHEYLTQVGGPTLGGADALLGLDGVLHSFGEAVIDALSELPPRATLAALGKVFVGGPTLHYTGRTDLMLACYPGGGARYGPHIDNIDGDGREHLDAGRCFTLVYYLNDADWDTGASGGALRLHDVEADEPEAFDVAPRGDTLVIFRADLVLHEVRPANAERLAATVWMYGGSEEQHAQWRSEGRSPFGLGTSPSRRRDS